MLVLSRKRNQAIVINGDIRIVVAHISGKHVRLTVEAPPHVRVDREEVAFRKQNHHGVGRAEALVG
jgi:carbon storage regulator